MPFIHTSHPGQGIFADILSQASSALSPGSSLLARVWVHFQLTWQWVGRMLTWKLLKEGTCSKERSLCGENNHCTLTTGVNFFTQGHLPAGDFLDVVGVLFVGSWVASLDPLENPQNLFLGAGQVQPLHSPGPEEGGFWDLFSRQEDPVHLPWTEAALPRGRAAVCVRGPVLALLSSSLWMGPACLWEWPLMAFLCSVRASPQGLRPSWDRGLQGLRRRTTSLCTPHNPLLSGFLPRSLPFIRVTLLFPSSSPSATRVLSTASLFPPG